MRKRPQRFAGWLRERLGTILFQEKFDDASFAARGWYDSNGGTVVTTEHAPGSTSAFECAFAQGATGCTGGMPARHKFTPSDAILFRTGAHTTMKLDQFLMLPYIGDGSPVAQKFWFDDLTVATAKP